ncbi:MAG: GNAT family N-acetyltransferase [Candidatus Thiodiazotropha sp.]
MSLEQAFVTVDKSCHNLKTFDCGNSSMNMFLARYATKHSKLGLSRTYVLAEQKKEAKTDIAAYYTLTASTVTRVEIPSTQKSLPTYPVPVVMLARLAVDKEYQGTGLGAKTLVYALRQSAHLSKAGLPAYGLILDVIDAKALAFYKHFELFDSFTNNPMRLFVAMKTLEDI